MMRAKDLKVGDAYSKTGTSYHKAVIITKLGAWLYVGYAYQVSDVNWRGEETVKFHKQPILPIEKIHVNTKLILD